MADYIDGPTRTFQFNAATAEALRVVLSGGKMVVADASTVEDGTAFEEVLTADDCGPVRLRTAEGTTRFIASEAINAGNNCYAAAGGKVAASGSILIGKAFTGASANNDVLEVERVGEASNAGAAGGTTAAAFLVDSDSTTPKLEVGAQTAGTGNYKNTIKPAATLTGNVVTTFPNTADAQVKTDQTFAATPNSSAGAGNSIPVGVRQVNVGAPANNADDFIVLPAIASVNIGDEIVIACNGGSNFEMRTPASSNTKINDVDADGTQEYLCTDTHLIRVVKHTTTSWVAVSYTKLGAVVTAVVPD